jgi:hypothetical protein
MEVVDSGRGHKIEAPVTIQVPARDVGELCAADHAPAERDAAGIDEDVDGNRARHREVAASIPVEIAAGSTGRLVTAPLGENVHGGLKGEVAVAPINLQRVVQLGHEDVAAAVAVEVRDVGPDPHLIPGVVGGTDRARRRECDARPSRQYANRVSLANNDVYEAVSVEVADAEWQGGAAEGFRWKERPVAAADPDHEIGRDAWPQGTRNRRRDEISPPIPIEIGRPDVERQVRVKGQLEVRGRRSLGGQRQRKHSHYRRGDPYTNAFQT